MSQEKPEWSLTYLQEPAICFVLIQINPVYDIPYHLSKLIQYILALTPSFSACSPSSSFPHQYSVCSFFFRMLGTCSLSFSWLCCFHQRLVISSFLGTNIFLSTLLLSKLSLFSFLNVRLLISLILIFKYFLFFFLKCLLVSRLNINFQI